MSLVRFLPVPSDRMGMLWSLLTIAEALVLEYGPSGTTHYSMGLYGNLGVQVMNRLFTTHLSEDDVIMGDVKRLEDSILELDKMYRPKVVFVVTSATTSVIGTDIKGVCRYMQKEVNALLIPVDEGGFRGDYSIGIEAACKLLVKNLVSDNAVKLSGQYNILGASMWRYRMTSDLWEISNLMKEAFAMNPHTCLCCDTSVSKIEAMSGAELNIVVGNEGLGAAQWLEENFGIPYIYAVPYGYQGTIRFLEAVSEKLRQPAAFDIMQRIRGKEKGLSMLRMYAMMGRRKQPVQGMIKGDYDFVKGVSAFLEEAGIQVIHKICSHSLKAIQEADTSVTYFKEEGQWLSVVRSLQHALVIGDDVLLQQCDATNQKLRAASPILSGSQVASHLPFMGEKGADSLQEFVQEYYQG